MNVNAVNSLFTPYSCERLLNTLEIIRASLHSGNLRTFQVRPAEVKVWPPGRDDATVLSPFCSALFCSVLFCPSQVKRRTRTRSVRSAVQLAHLHKQRRNVWHPSGAGVGRRSRAAEECHHSIKDTQASWPGLVWVRHTPMNSPSRTSHILHLVGVCVRPRLPSCLCVPPPVTTT